MLVHSNVSLLHPYKQSTTIFRIDLLSFEQAYLYIAPFVGVPRHTSNFSSVILLNILVTFRPFFVQVITSSHLLLLHVCPDLHLDWSSFVHSTHSFPL